MRPVGDRSQLFSTGLTTSWILLVALPIALSIVFGRPFEGLPLASVVLWFILLRAAQNLSPSRRGDRLLRRGRAAAALALTDRALALTGRGAWSGTRRLLWLNRRTVALLALGRTDAALGAALDAIEHSPDPETLANCALVLLRLNRYDEAARAARIAEDLTRERSVLAYTVLAAERLARGMPAEAEALARAAVADVQALLPLVRPEHHVACLAVLARAERAQREREMAADLLSELRRAARPDPALGAVALVEQAEGLVDKPESADVAFGLLAQAMKLAAPYLHWYITQPGTLMFLRKDERFAPLQVEAEAELDRLREASPDAERVASALNVAHKDARPRPAPQASRGAISIQVVTLAGTLILLLWWTWRFFIIG